MTMDDDVRVPPPPKGGWRIRFYHFMFSPLQQYILAECYARREKVDRKFFQQFYSTKASIPVTHQVEIITRSLERLIGRGFLVGYGIRTPQKWFIREVKITPLGRRGWKAWLARRQTALLLRSV